MTMHLLPAYVTTTRFKRRKKNKSASAIKADQEHQKFLRKMGAHPDDPGRRSNFRARHNCDEKKSKLSAGYWACKDW